MRRLAAEGAIQGDLVAYHGLYTAPNPLGDHPLVCVDIWRVQGGQIVEHWDALMPTPSDAAEVLVGGGGDGFAPISGVQVASNASRARRLYEVGVRQRDEEVLLGLLAEELRTHQPGVAEGRAAFVAWVNEAQPSVEVRKTVASGDLVFVQLLVKTSEAEQVVYDILRFSEAGRVTDQWRVSQDRLSLAEAANPHPHF